MLDMRHANLSSDASRCGAGQGSHGGHRPLPAATDDGIGAHVCRQASSFCCVRPPMFSFAGDASVVTQTTFRAPAHADDSHYGLVLLCTRVPTHHSATGEAQGGEREASAPAAVDTSGVNAEDEEAYIALQQAPPVCDCVFLQRSGCDRRHIARAQPHS